MLQMTKKNQWKKIQKKVTEDDVFSVHTMYSVHSFFADCKTNQVWRDGGLVDESVPCKFPFVNEEVIYYTCTYNHSQLYGGNLQDQIGKGTLKKLGLVEEPTVDTGTKA